MFVVKWVSMLAFVVMVSAGIWRFAGEVPTASLVCYISAGVFASGIFYSTTLCRIFPKSNMGDRVADILEKSVEARQVALMHHIQHEHRDDLGAIKQLQRHEDEGEDVLVMPPASEDVFVMPPAGGIVDWVEEKALES